MTDLMILIAKCQSNPSEQAFLALGRYIRRHPAYLPTAVEIAALARMGIDL